jgi:hypothetical protein
MGIFDRLHKKSEAQRDARIRAQVATLISRLEGADRENSIRAGIDLGQMIREDAERLGDSILEVYVTSTGSAGTWSSEENITKFVKKYNDLLAEYER